MRGGKLGGIGLDLYECRLGHQPKQVGICAAAPALSANRKNHFLVDEEVVKRLDDEPRASTMTLGMRDRDGWARWVFRS